MHDQTIAHLQRLAELIKQQGELHAQLIAHVRIGGMSIWCRANSTAIAQIEQDLRGLSTQTNGVLAHIKLYSDLLTAAQ